MNALRRYRRLSGAVFLVLCGAPVCAAAQDFVCWPIVSGDTASGLALRLTGAAATAYGEMFQIYDPTRRMFVPRSHYSRLSTSWQACVVRDLVKSNLLAPAPAAAPPAASLDDVGDAVKFGAAVSLMLLMISAVAGYAAGRPMPPALRRAGEDFVRTFAAPLVDPTSPVPPIAARLRFIRRTKRLEVCLAPHGGRRYPNLSDHKKNVEYDVSRVIRTIGAHRVACDRLHAEGPWVIVSIRLTEPKQAGAK